MLAKRSLEAIVQADARDDRVCYGKECISSGAGQPSGRDHCIYCRSADDLQHALQRYPPKDSCHDYKIQDFQAHGGCVEHLSHVTTVGETWKGRRA